IRRVAKPGGTHRQRLPPALPSVMESVHPGERGWSQVADAVGGRERGDVQEHSGGAISRRARRNAPGAISHPECPSVLSTIDRASATMASRCAWLVKLSA